MLFKGARYISKSTHRIIINMGGGLAEGLVNILRKVYGINAVYGGRSSHKRSAPEGPRTPEPCAKRAKTIV